MKAKYRLGLVLGTAVLISACGTTKGPKSVGFQGPMETADANDLLVVDCLYPPQLRQLGNGTSYLTPRRPAKATALECRIRGGEYVAFDRANIHTALGVWLDSAEKGDAEAQAYVGEIYARGMGSTPNYEKARFWYEKAAEQDNKRALYNLGQLYEKGLGVAADEIKSLNYYRRASGLDEDLALSSTLSAKAEALAEEQAAVLHQEILRKSAQIRGLNQRLNAERSRTEASQKKLSQLDQSLAEANAQLAAKKQSNDKAALASLQQQVDALTAERQSAQSTLSTTQAQLTQAKNALTQARAVQTKLEAKQQDPAYRGLAIALSEPSVAFNTRSMPRLRVPNISTRYVSGSITPFQNMRAAFVNERPLQVDESGFFDVYVPLPKSVNPVVIRAVGVNNEQESVAFEVHKDASQKSHSDSEKLKALHRVAHDIDFGRYHALVIGNNDYRYFNDLKTAVNDATVVGQILKERFGFKVRVLKNAKRHTLLSAINAYRETLTEKDNLLIYYAGHGERDEALSGYWLPVDAEPGNRANWIPNAALSATINTIAAKHIMVVADSCYSGVLTSASSPKINLTINEKFLKKWLQGVNRAKSRTALTSGGIEPVLDSGGGGHSVFAYNFIQALNNQQGAIDANRLYLSIAKKVTEGAKRAGQVQIPRYGAIKHTGHGFGEFVFVPG